MSSKIPFIRSPLYLLPLHTLAFIGILSIGVPVPVWLFAIIVAVISFLYLRKSPERQHAVREVYRNNYFLIRLIGLGFVIVGAIFYCATAEKVSPMVVALIMVSLPVLFMYLVHKQFTHSVSDY